MGSLSKRHDRQNSGGTQLFASILSSGFRAKASRLNITKWLHGFSRRMQHSKSVPFYSNASIRGGAGKGKLTVFSLFLYSSFPSLHQGGYGETTSPATPDSGTQTHWCTATAGWYTNVPGQKWSLRGGMEPQLYSILCRMPLSLSGAHGSLNRDVVPGRLVVD